MRSALFVDFDNVYSGLRRLDPALAERFARQPSDWLGWLADRLELPPHTAPDARRRLLVRRCYLNPQAYQRYRPAFNRAGFEIVDCPALTSENKTSTDIHMVLDIVDLLQCETRYDEFIVFSADADFTPVLRKLRRWDRRTTALAIGFPSAAYQASADLLIDPDDFVRQALGAGEADTWPSTPRAPAAAAGVADTALPTPRAATAAPGDEGHGGDAPHAPPAPLPPPLPKPERRAEPAPADAAAVRAAVARFIVDAVADSPRPVALPWLASKALAAVPGLDAATWAGCDTFRGLLQALPLASLRADWPAGVLVDPARHALPERVAEPARASPAPAEGAAGEAASIARLIRDEVARAGKPVACGRLGQLIAERYPRVAADWGGKGSFRRYLDSLDLGPLRCDWASAGGQLRDPSVAADAPELPSGWSDDGALLPLVRQVQAATGMPLLSRREMRAVFEALVADVAEQPFALGETGKRVRDRCRGIGAVSRGDVNFVLKGVALGGHVFGAGDDSVAAVAAGFVRSVLSLCDREQLALDASQRAQLRDWAGAGSGPQCADGVAAPSTAVPA